MITYADLKIFDRDFRILKQLNANEYRAVMDGGSGGVCERIRFLIDLGVVESKKGRHGGHKLTRPISSIPFSYWTDMISGSPYSPTMKLLRQFDNTSVDELLTYYPYSGAGWSLPLDHAVGILSCLSADTPILSRLIQYPLLNVGYMAHIYTELSRCGVTINVSRKGVKLAKPFDQIILADVLPVISHTSRVFSAMTNHVSRMPLTSLLPYGGVL